MTQKEQDIAEEIVEQFRLSKLYLDVIHLRMNQQEELYRMYIDKSSYPHSARVFDPRVFRVIETITPRMVANDPTGDFYPVEKTDTSTAYILKALLKYDWRRAKMFPKLVKTVKSGLIFGTAFGRTYWDYREKDKPRMVPKDVNGRMVWSPDNTEQIRVCVHDGPNFEPLNIYDCYPDPNATCVEDMRWFIYRQFKTVDDLEAENELRGTEHYKNLKQLRKEIELTLNKKGKRTTAGSDMQFREHRRIMLSTEEFHGQDESNPDFPVLRRFTEDGWVDYVPDYDIIIREVDNPYFHGGLPIVYWTDYPYPGELYGMGEIEPLDRMQRAVNAVLNQRLDNVQLVLNNMWKVKKNAGVDIHTLVSNPGQIITTNDMGAIEPINVPDVTGSTFVQTMDYLTSAIQNGSGITDYTVGLNQGSNTVNKTATGVRLIQQEANAQFKLKIQLFNKQVIEEVANQWKDMRLQFTTERQKLRIIGKEDVEELLQKTDLAKTSVDGEPIAPGDFETPTRMTYEDDNSFAFIELFPEDIQPAIVGDYDFIARVSSDQVNDPVAMQNNLFTAIDRVTKNEWVQGLQLAGKTLNFEKMTKDIFDKLDLGLETSEYVEDIQPQEPIEAPPSQDLMPLTNPMQPGLTPAPNQGNPIGNGQERTNPGTAGIPSSAA